MKKLKNLMKGIIFGEEGQGMTEYILIVVLIAIAAIVAFQYFRDKLSAKVEKAADDLESAQ
ncbi:MAG: Flp family type IVb pilin [bacterium]|nr:Flp family type IVb pilin [bacterium]